jgi:hypothetical protein
MTSTLPNWWSSTYCLRRSIRPVVVMYSKSYGVGFKSTAWYSTCGKRSNLRPRKRAFADRTDDAKPCRYRRAFPSTGHSPFTTRSAGVSDDLAFSQSRHILLCIVKQFQQHLFGVLAQLRR